MHCTDRWKTVTFPPPFRRITTHHFSENQRMNEVKGAKPYRFMEYRMPRQKIVKPNPAANAALR